MDQFFYFVPRLAQSCRLTLIRLEVGLKHLPPPWYIFLYLSNNSNKFSENWFFHQNSNWFLQCQHLMLSSLPDDIYFLCMSSVGKMNVSLRILVTYLNIGGYYQLISLYMGNLIYSYTNFNDRVETWWRHQKRHVTLIIILVFFERSYVRPHSCKARA